MTSPTTPRDAIGLSERLRYISLVMFSALEKNVPMSVWEKDPAMIAEAATQLDDLQERVKEQQEGMETLAKEHLVLARDYDTLQARMKELEREVEAFHRHEQTLRDNGIASHTEAVVRVVDAESRATRAEQERDEALERAAKVAEGPLYKEKYRGTEGHNWYHAKEPGEHNRYGNGRHDAAAAIRQLKIASGPDKEKSE